LTVRRSVLKVSAGWAVAVAVVLCAACGSVAPKQTSPSQTSSSPHAAAPAAPRPQPTKLHAAWSVISATQLPLWAAQDGGYFARHGLDVSMSQAGAGVGLSALVGGTLDVVETTASTTMVAVASGLPVVFLGANMTKMVGLMVVRANDTRIRSIKDMKGKRVGVTTPGSLSDSAVALVAHEAGLVPQKDFTVLRFRDLPTIESALRNGAIDIGFLDPPSSYTAGADLKVVFNVASLNVPYLEVGFAAGRAFAEQHPREIAAFEAAVGDGVRRMQQDPAFAARVLEHYSKVQDPKILQESVQTVLPYLSPEFVTDLKGLENSRLFASYSVPNLKGFDVRRVLLQPAGTAG
jgi:NitT/TauT family transport system substrate-binding protein